MAELTLQDLADKVDDVTRLLNRQAAVLSGLVDGGSAASGPDAALLVELHALYSDAIRCAATARYRRERDAFIALGAGLERLITGRDGRVVAPAAGDAFDAATMEAVEIVEVADQEADRTVAAVHETGLLAGGRSVRPARVSVNRRR